MLVSITFRVWGPHSFCSKINGESNRLFRFFWIRFILHGQNTWKTEREFCITAVFCNYNSKVLYEFYFFLFFSLKTFAIKMEKTLKISSKMTKFWNGPSFFAVYSEFNIPVVTYCLCLCRTLWEVLFCWRALFILASEKPMGSMREVLEVRREKIEI